MRKALPVGLLLMVMVSQGSGFGLMGGLMANPATVLNAARYMTQILMRNMAQKRTSSAPCIEHVSRSTVTFFNEAAVSLQLGRLLQMTMRRAAVPGSAAVPLNRFCQMANVGRLRTASVTFVSRMTCLGGGAVGDTDRLFRSLVYTIEHVCRDGGRAAMQFMEDAHECRRLDAKHEEQMGRVGALRRSRRSETVLPRVLSTTTTGNTTRLLVTLAATTTVPSSPANKTASAAEETEAKKVADAPLLVYPSLQECLDDVNELLPPGAQLSPQEEMTDFLLTLPALLPRLLQQDGLPQFCPALLKGGDCAHLALSQCPERTQKAMARFFQTTLRGILCDNMPDDEVLKQLIWSNEVKEKYFNL